MATWEIEIDPSEVRRIVESYAREHLGITDEAKFEAVNEWPIVLIKMGEYPPKPVAAPEPEKPVETKTDTASAEPEPERDDEAPAAEHAVDIRAEAEAAPDALADPPRGVDAPAPGTAPERVTPAAEPPRPEAKLTPNQRAVWIAVARAISKTGVSPTYRVIGEAAGLKNPGLVSVALTSLQHYRYIENVGKPGGPVWRVLSWPLGIEPTKAPAQRQTKKPGQKPKPQVAMPYRPAPDRPKLTDDPPPPAHVSAPPSINHRGLCAIAGCKKGAQANRMRLCAEHNRERLAELRRAKEGMKET